MDVTRSIEAPVLFSFFAGAGFLDLGFETSGYQIGLVNELQNDFLRIYRHARRVLGLPEPKYGYDEGDVARFLEHEGRARLQCYMEEVRKDGRPVGFIGGPPCPDFSVGGKNRGSTGENGRLSETFASLICTMQPDFFLFENVKGLISTAKHRAFFNRLKARFHSARYTTTQRLINALEYGVPQDRERIILLGFRRDFLDSIGLAEAEKGELDDSEFPWRSHATISIDQIRSAPWPQAEPFCEDSVRECPLGIPECLTVEHWFRMNGVNDHPNAIMQFRPKAGLVRFQSVEEGDDSRKSFKRLHRWRYSPTACYGNNEVHLHPYKARRLSVAEALAIQSLPRDFEVPSDITLTSAFKAVGNGVPYLAAKAIAESILVFLQREDSKNAVDA